MKTGISSSAYFGLHSTEADYAKIKLHGYDCIDYQNFINTETELFTMSDSEFEKFLLREKAYAQSVGIEIFQTHGPWRYPPQDCTEEDRAERMEKMKKSIWGTSLLECKYFVIHPIMPYGADKDPEPERLFEMNFEFMSALLPVAKEHGVVICLENMPMTQLSLSRPAEILEFVKAINSENMQVCIDTGHCAVFGESPADAVRLTGEYLKVLHVHDNDGRMDLHWLPYYGVVDWDDFNNALNEIGYDGCLSLETNVSRKIPADIKEHHQIGLALIANKLAE